MVVVPLSKPVSDFPAPSRAQESETMSWVGYAAGGTLVAAGLLLISGQRRSGIVAAAAGSALALLDQRETVNSWWNALPGLIDNVTGLLNQVQGAVEDVAVKRETLRRVLARTGPAL
jgi:hypothetical protein